MDSWLVFHSSLVFFSRMVVRLGKTIMGKKHSVEEIENEDIYEDKSVPELKHLDPYCKGKFVEEYENNHHCPRCGGWHNRTNKCSFCGETHRGGSNG